MLKQVNATFEDFAVQIDTNADNEFVMLRVSNFVHDEIASKPGHQVFKENETLEIYPNVDEVKQLIKLLTESLPIENHEIKRDGFR